MRLTELHHQSLVFIKEALNRGVTKVELATALKSEIELLNQGNSRTDDGTNIDGLIFGNNREAAEHHRAAIAVAEQSLIERYPVLLKLDHDASILSGCTVNPDRVDWFLANYEAIYVSSQNSVSHGKTASDWPPCGGWRNSLLFAACIGMAGGVCGPSVGGFALCAWGCSCMTCPESFPAICSTSPN